MRPRYRNGFRHHFQSCNTSPWSTRPRRDAGHCDEQPGAHAGRRRGPRAASDQPSGSDTFRGSDLSGVGGWTGAGGDFCRSARSATPRVSLMDFVYGGV